jgi:hypothetical protein
MSTYCEALHIILHIVYIVQCWRFLIAFEPRLYSYSTQDAVRIGNSFITILNHTSLQSHTIISYAVTRLHNYNPYTFVTKITYNTLTRLHWLTSQLSITFTNYRRLYIFTLPVSVSYRDLTRRADFQRLTRRIARYKLLALY